MPFPREETTPPVINTYRAMGFRAYRGPTDSAKEKSTGCRFIPYGVQNDSIRSSGRSRLYRHSGFGARYEEKSLSFRSRPDDRSASFRGSATQKWAIFAISLRDAADFGPECVEEPFWWATPRRSLRLFRTEIRHAPRPKPECRYSLKHHHISADFHALVEVDHMVIDHAETAV